MSGLTELLARVEAATGPDRGLDAMIVCAFCPSATVGHYTADDDGDIVFHAQEIGIANKSVLPEITASIDASLALVAHKLPGWFWRGGHVPSFHWTGSRNVDCWAHLSRTDASNCDKEDEATGWCNTVPLALIAALLRALISRTPATGGKP